MDFLWIILVDFTDIYRYKRILLNDNNHVLDKNLSKIPLLCEYYVL